MFRRFTAYQQCSETAHKKDILCHPPDDQRLWKDRRRHPRSMSTDLTSRMTYLFQKKERQYLRSILSGAIVPNVILNAAPVETPLLCTSVARYHGTTAAPFFYGTSTAGFTVLFRTAIPQLLRFFGTVLSDVDTHYYFSAFLNITVWVFLCFTFYFYTLGLAI